MQLIDPGVKDLVGIKSNALRTILWLSNQVDSLKICNDRMQFKRAGIDGDILPVHSVSRPVLGVLLPCKFRKPSSPYPKP